MTMLSKLSLYVLTYGTYSAAAILSVNLVNNYVKAQVFQSLLLYAHCESTDDQVQGSQEEAEERRH